MKWQGYHVTPPERNPHATLTLAGDRALILNAPGELVLAQLSPEGYRQLSRVPIFSRTWATPAFANQCVFVRNDREIICVPLAGR